MEHCQPIKLASKKGRPTAPPVKDHKKEEGLYSQNFIFIITTYECSNKLEFFVTGKPFSFVYNVMFYLIGPICKLRRN
jgi:hypothetical protein